MARPKKVQTGRRAGGTGSVYQKTVRKKDKKTGEVKEYVYWVAEATNGYDGGTGAQIKESHTFKTKAEAVQALNQMNCDIQNNDFFKPEKITLGAWIDIWLSDYTKDLEYNTLKHYRLMCESHIKPKLGAVKLSELTTPLIQRFYNELAVSGKKRKRKEKDGTITEYSEPLSSKSIKNIHGILTKCLNQAVEINYIKANPASRTKINPAKRKPIHPLDDSQIADFMKTVAGDEYELILKLILFSGMREAEALGLTWDNINYMDSSITIEKQLLRKSIADGGLVLSDSTKNDKTRVITVAPFVMDLLKKRWTQEIEQRFSAGELWQGWQNSKERKTALVFSNPLGKPLSSKTMYDHYKRIAEKIGAPDTCIHDLRHSFAVLSLQNGDDVKTVQENLGHATASFTLDVYGHVSKRMREDSASRMQDYIQNIG